MLQYSPETVLHVRGQLVTHISIEPLLARQLPPYRPRFTPNELVRTFFKGKKPARLENLRSSFLRGMKKTVRLHLKHKPKETPLGEFVLANREECMEVASTASGPGIDNKNKSASHKTYNGKYLQQFFSSPLVQQLFVLYYGEIGDIKKVLKLSCCRNCHKSDCEERWRELEHVVKNFLGTRVENSNY